MSTVTMANFVRAETDNYFAAFVRDGAFGKLVHSRDLADVHHQTVIRMNRDTLYSRGIFDLEAAPVTITLPDAGQRFMSLLAIDEDHYALSTCYDSEPHSFTRAAVGTRYLALLVRTFVDPDDEADLKAVHALQDAIRVEQAATGAFKTPAWNEKTLADTRAAIGLLDGFDPSRAFGRREDVEAMSHLIGTARGWGGNPPRDATYLAGQPQANDGTTVHRVIVPPVPVDGFWSISVYDENGYFAPNPQNHYSLNNVTAKQDADGSCTIQFGGCEEGTDNCLPITPGWNYTVRLYCPRAEILDGTWAFPDAEPVP